MFVMFHLEQFVFAANKYITNDIELKFWHGFHFGQIFFKNVCQICEEYVSTNKFTIPFEIPICKINLHLQIKSHELWMKRCDSMSFLRPLYVFIIHVCVCVCAWVYILRIHDTLHNQFSLKLHHFITDLKLPKLKLIKFLPLLVKWRIWKLHVNASAVPLNMWYKCVCLIIM